MAVGPEVPQPWPPAIITAFVRAKVPRSVNHTRTPVGRWHGIGASWRGRRGRVGSVFTRCTVRTLGEGREGSGFRGPFALERGGGGVCRWTVGQRDAGV